MIVRLNYTQTETSLLNLIYVTNMKHYENIQRHGQVFLGIMELRNILTII